MRNCIERIINYLLCNIRKICEPHIDFTDLFDSSKFFISQNSRTEMRKFRTDAL